MEKICPRICVCGEIEFAVHFIKASLIFFIKVFKLRYILFKADIKKTVNALSGRLIN